jgi:hypothetical protein
MPKRGKRKAVFVAALLLASSHAVADDGKDKGSSATPLCIECVTVRVGLPRVVRGPSPGIPDGPFTEIELPGGHFRGFSSNSTTYAIDGTTPSDMAGTARPVMPPGPRGQYGESGQWILHVERSGKTVLGWVHDETGDKPGQGLKSMSLAVSEDDGLSWRRLGQIITGTEPVIQGRVTGEGDCGAVDGKDGYYYAYCLRNRDHGNIVARAPIDHPGPGNWKKYFDGAWTEAGLGGNATKLASGVGVSTAYWQTAKRLVNLGGIAGGVGIAFSQDHVTFTPLPEPLIPKLSGSWRRPEPNELLTYWSLLDRNTGLNQLSNQWLLTYMDIQPNEGFDKRYQVIRPVDISLSRHGTGPQVGIMLARWRNAALHDRWSTTAAVPGNFASYQLDGKLGYLMTVSDPSAASIELQDCFSQWPGHPDHMLEQQSFCDAGKYRRLRTAGWVYAGSQPGTVALYRCYNAQERTHFASNAADCEGLGAKERLLGYALSQ